MLEYAQRYGDVISVLGQARDQSGNNMKLEHGVGMLDGRAGQEEVRQASAYASRANVRPRWCMRQQLLGLITGDEAMEPRVQDLPSIDMHATRPLTPTRRGP